MKIVLFANTDWYLYNFRLPLARKLHEYGHEIILLSPPGPFSKRLINAGFEWVEFQFARKSTNPLTELSTVMRLHAIYKSIKPDLVHHFTIKCVLYGGIVAKKLGIANVSAITGTGHIFTTRSLKNSILRPLVSTAYKLALRNSEVIFQNPDDMAVFARLGFVNASNTHLIKGSGVNTSKFRPALPKPQSQSKAVGVVMICRLLKEKGIAEFVSASRIIKERIPNIIFQVAGEIDPGNPSSISTEQLNRWIAEGNIQFLGHVVDIAELLRAHDVCILPSYYGEGVPRSLIEAAATGLPLVSTDMPGCREICRDAENGYLIPPKDSASLAAAIIKIAENKSLASRFGARSREIATNEFSEPSVIERTFIVYNHALARNSSTLSLFPSEQPVSPLQTEEKMLE